MMPPYSRSRPSWASSDDYAVFNFIVILVGACVFSYLLWSYYHAEISGLVMLIMHREICLIDQFSDRYRRADQQMMASDPSAVTLKDLYSICQAVGMFFRIPATALILVLGIVCTLRAAPSRFKRKFDLDGLIKEQASGCPVISAFAKRHLKLIAPSEEKTLPADYALTPAEWIARFVAGQPGRFEEQKARAALASQLGDRWTGPADASLAAKLLFTVFTLHLAERRDDAMQILGEAAICVSDARQDGENGPEEALKLSPVLNGRIDTFLEKNLDAAQNAAALRIAERHAYVTTAMMALLTAARIKAGVMAPAQFVWLKLVDRNLWYALHSLGYEIEGTGRYIHPNPRIEALGARCHWAAERAVGRPILKPNLDEALATLRRYAQAHEAGPDV